VPPAWAHCAAAVSFISPWRELIIEFKFRQNPALSRFLADVIGNAPLAAMLISEAEVLIPVPLAAMRLRERGFNQSVLLARHLAHDRVNEQVLWRLRHTAPQSGLDRAARQSNLLHSVAVNPLMQNAIRKRRLLLIDDVMTTGSTLTVCAQALLLAGAKEVNCVVFARAEPQTSPQWCF